MRISDWSSDIASFDLLSDSIAGMRQSVSQMRMQRIDKLFAPLPRIVRDLAQDMGKKIAFQTSGGEVELDREMMENIRDPLRSEEHTSELQSLMRISYAVFCLKKKKKS